MKESRGEPLRWFLFLAVLCQLISEVHGVCYLEDANADCEVCWKTTYADAEDKLGVTVATECPDGIVELWEQQLPETMVEMFEYPVVFSIKVDNTLFPVREKGDDPHVPHANIHSCIASRGACTPFVSNTPGLSTHTPALKGSMDDNGYARFETTVRLTEEQYTIIGHVRFYVADPDPAKPLIKYDTAIGISRIVQAQTTLCDAGSIYNQTLGSCQVCPAGTAQIKAECVPCPAGSFGPAEGLATCLPCDKGFSPRAGMTFCEECPLNSQRQSGTPGVSVEECACKFGFYDKHGPGQPCQQCPAGAWCEGGKGEMAVPYPLPGFWGDRECAYDPECENGDVFYDCVPPGECLGGKNFTCRKGRKGRQCKETESGFFEVGGQWVVECGSRGVLVNILGICGVIVVWMGINSVAAGNYDALDIALLYVQITGMVSSYGMRWHKNVDHVNTVLSIANFDVDFVSPMCIGSWSPVHGFYTQLLLPLIYVVVHGILIVGKNLLSVVGIRKAPVTTREVAEQKIVNHGLSFLIIVYHTLCLKCFQVFRCQDFPDGNAYMVFAPQVQCWDATHRGMVVVASLYIPIVLLGLPVFLFYVVHKAMEDGKLHDHKLMAKYGFFYSRYDTDYKWWECLIMVRRLSIALVSIMIDTSMLQAAITIVILLVLLNLHTHTRPFVSDRIDFLEVFTLCGSILYALAGMLFYPSITQQAQGELCVGDTDNKACTAEGDLKLIIGIILLVWFGATLLLAFVVAGLSINQIHAQEKARKIVKMVLKLDEGADAGLEDVEGGDSFELPPGGSSTSSLLKRVSSYKTWQREGSNVNINRMVSVSANQLALHDLLSGKLLLDWANTIKDLPLEQRQAIIDEWGYVGTVINSIPYDVTHYSTTNLANTMRIMTQLPELEDWLCESTTEDRAALLHVVERYSAFLDKAGNTKTRYHAAGMVEAEHKPVVLMAMMTCTDQQHSILTTLLDKILSASDELHRNRTDRLRSISHSFRKLPSFKHDSEPASSRDLYVKAKLEEVNEVDGAREDDADEAGGVLSAVRPERTRRSSRTGTGGSPNTSSRSLRESVQAAEMSPTSVSAELTIGSWSRPASAEAPAAVVQ